MVTVPGAWVTLHRVAPDSSGPVDSVRADAGGRYSMRYKPLGGDAGAGEQAEARVNAVDRLAPGNDAIHRSGCFRDTLHR